jgi:hypothetical protein
MTQVPALEIDHEAYAQALVKNLMGIMPPGDAVACLTLALVLLHYSSTGPGEARPIHKAANLIKANMIALAKSIVRH